MAYYQFSLPMTASKSYQLIKTVCERSCTIKQDCPNESIEVRTRFRMGKGSLPFVFYLRELEDGTEIMVSSDNATLTGALVAMNGNKPESVWDLPDKEWSDLIEDFRKEYPAFPLQDGKPVPVAAEPCDDGMGQESISRGKNVSLGRAAVGGLMFGSAGAVVGVVTVLLAAQAPAKRAAKVSPMAAVSGSTQNVPVGRAAHAGKGRVELALGVRHATASKKNWALMTASFALSIVLALGFTVLLQFASLLLPSLVPWQPDVLYNGYGNAQVLPGSMTRTLLEVPGVAHAWGCTGLVDTPASSDKGNVDHVIFCSYDDYMLESSRSVVVRGRMPGAGNEVMTIYNKNNPMQIGDVITVNGVPLTIVGAFSEGTFPDDVTLIAPEALFRQVAGDQNYNMVGVQLDRTADEDTLFTLADLATDDVIMQDLRESNRQDRGTYYAVRIVLYGFLAIIGGISLLNIVNSISMSVSARARQYGAMRAVGMEDVQLCRMIAAEAGTYAASGLLVGVAAGLVLHRALYTRLITHYFGVVWRVPFGLLAVLCLFVAGAAALAVHGPVKRLQAMPVTAAINEL